MISRLAARHGAQFVKHVVPAVIKPARTLWNEFIGFVFLCLGVGFAIRTVPLAREFARIGTTQGIGELLRLIMAGSCTVVMLYFGLTSFLRARKISRS